VGHNSFFKGLYHLFDLACHREPGFLKEKMLKTKVDWVLYYFELGFNIIPSTGRIPLVKWKKYEAIRVLKEQIIDWWSRWPNADIILINGPISNTFVIDIDGVEIPFNLPLTPVVETAPKRFHFYFKNPEIPLKNTVSEIAPGIDTRTNAGLTVLPPSRHYKKFNGEQTNEVDGQYQFIVDFNQPLADLPQEILEKLKNSSKKYEKLNMNSFIGTKIGKRDNRLFGMAYEMLKFGGKSRSVLDAMTWLNSTFDPPFEEKIVIQKFESAVKTLVSGRSKNGY
jgi:hypothetical protein